MSATDVLVVGGGPGGYAAAIRAAQRDCDVTLVERDGVGGTCLNHGCIPSKALVTASNLVTDLEDASRMGIYAEPFVDVGELIDWKDDVVARLTDGVATLCEANGVAVREGTARFVDDHTVEITTDDTLSELAFESAIIATGSRPMGLPGFSSGDEPILNSRQVLALEEAPRSLAVVGAGYIGMELSTVFAKLGTDVTVIEMEDTVLPEYESDLTRPVKRRAESVGVDFRFGHAAVEWSRNDDDGTVTLTTEDADGASAETIAERVLVAIGREPVTETLDLESISLEPSERGFLETDDQMRTTRDHVFAVGDVAGEPMLAHEAVAEGLVAAEVAAGGDAELNRAAVPTAVFVDPEIATVGVTAAEARDAGHSPVVGEFPFDASGRALTIAETEGFVRVVADGDDGRLLGAQIVGPDAAELIGELGVAVEAGLTLEDIATTVHMHPTLSEAIMEASENALGRAIHTLNR